VWQIGGAFESSGIKSAAIPPTPLFLDTYTNATVAYSFRKLRNAYAGSAVRIRESGGDTELDIGFDGSGNFDTAAAAAHIGGGSGFIVTWYDQSGNGINITQATAGNQPAYTASAILSKPSAQFVSNDSLVAATAAFAGMSQMTNLSVMQQDSGDNEHVLWGVATAASAGIDVYTTYIDVIYFDFGGQGAGGRLNVGQPVGWDDTPHVLELYRDSSDLQGITVDGTSLASDTRTDDCVGGTVNFYIGTSLTGIFFGGYVSEFVIWSTDLGASRDDARNDINTYWSVF
jgi:hypothetical protein